MATVHPSRMGLVPQDPKDVYPDLRRAMSRSPPRGHDRDRRERVREREKARIRESDDSSERGRDGDRDRDRERDRERPNDRRDRRRDRDYDRTSPRRTDDRDRDKDRGRYRERERDDEVRDRDRSRRASPEYGDYKRPASPGPATPPPSTYLNRQPRDGTYERRGGYGAGSDYLESRRFQREDSTYSIWPPSPKAPARTLSPERGSSRKKAKRDRSETPTESSDSESERRWRERKARKRARKEKERRERKERKVRSRSYDGSDDEERSRERRRSRKNKSRSRPQSPSPGPTPSSARMSEDEGEWVEKPVTAAPLVITSQSNASMPPPATIPSHITMQEESDSEDDSDTEVGPQPLMKMITSKRVDERAYGGALLRGEGSAMAAFLKDDTQTRIPRRGEIGLTSDEIAQFEAVGYVMSGSRHKRMNAVRMRKENQVISAEEKRGILKLQKEERERREAILREEFSELVHEKLKVKGTDTKSTVT